jgi:ATP-dependent Clp protease ATP-binding subunit ClpX
MPKLKDTKSTLYCSFCGKSQHEVRKLIAGPTVFICDECVDLCNDIVREETKNALIAQGDDLPLVVDKAIRNVGNYVPGNLPLKRDVTIDAAGRKASATAGGSGARVRMLFVGPSGCGISDILRIVWQSTGSTVVVVDASQLRETRLIGPGDIFHRLMQACDFSIERAAQGTIIIENLERLATGTDETRRIQEELEVVIRGSLVNVSDQQGPKAREGLMLDTSSISFFAISSALHRGRPPIISRHSEEKRRLTDTPENLISLLEARGFIRDLVQAFDSIREYEPIARAEFEAFLRSPNSVPLAEWRRMLGDEAVALEETSMEELLNQVERRGSGLRALNGILRVVAMRVAFERHSSPEPLLTITSDWLRENL